MNFAYLIVEGCYGYDLNYEGLPKLKFSIDSLRKNCNNLGKIYVYTGFDESNKHKVDSIHNFCLENNLSFANVGHLKHQFFSKRDHSNPCQLSILIEKLYLLKEHNSEEEICYVDLDTEFNEKMLEYNFDVTKPVMHAKEYPMLDNYRHLDEFFKLINKDIDPKTFMYNSGIIFIPKNMRKQIASEAIELVIEMNNYPDDRVRICNRLDEQLSISIFIQKYYGFGNLNILESYVRHFWASVVTEKYWVKENV